MKHILFATFLFHSILAVAQPSIPPSLLQDIEIYKLTAEVCEIDQNSRQCELMQLLMVKNTAIASQGKFLEMNPDAPSGFLDYVMYRAASGQNRVEKLESEGKMQAGRMYRAFKAAKEKICSIKMESLPCIEVLMYFSRQADIEAGLELTPPANISEKTKSAIRERIAKEYPSLNRSGRLLMEATILSKMQELAEAAPASIKKEPERKGKGICADKYSPSYDPQKCR